MPSTYLSQNRKYDSKNCPSLAAFVQMQKRPLFSQLLVHQTINIAFNTLVIRIDHGPNGIINLGNSYYLNSIL